MRNAAMWGVLALLFTLLLTSQPSVQARAQAQKTAGSLPGTFTFIPKADIEKVQQGIQNKTIQNDAPVRMVDAGKFNLGVYTLNTEPTQPRAAGAPVTGFYHRDIAEVYILATGSGSWRVGGEVENPTEEPDDRSRREVRGPSVTGTLKGFTNQKLTAGDVLIVGPGVPHSPGDFTERTKIIRVVIDPHKVMPIFPATSQASKPVPVATGKPASKMSNAWVYIPKADIDKVMKDIEKPGAYGDQAVRTIDLPVINYRVGVYVLHSANMPKTPQTPAKSGWYHTSIAEIYYFMRGAGGFMIGGTLENPKPDDPNSYATKMVRGPSVSGDFKGGTQQMVEAGDMLIAPTGVPHTPSMTTAVPRDIMRIGIDPDHVLPLK
jgi:mannose-6-phosphate isomerase-like protein (cupin superfamily)